MMPLVFLDHPGGSYWKDLGQFIDRQLLRGGMISPEDVRLYKITNSVDEAVDEILGFYRVFHSMRYVRNQLVLRLKRDLSEEALSTIRGDFTDILVDGSFELAEALPEESGEPDLAHMPRLVFHFNRRSLGRLRMLIDLINGSSSEDA
jgi:hypothetical protein